MLHITWVLLVVVTSLVLVGFRLEVPQRVHSAPPPQINTAPSNRVNRQNWEEIIQRNGVFLPQKKLPLGPALQVYFILSQFFHIEATSRFECSICNPLLTYPLPTECFSQKEMIFSPKEVLDPNLYLHGWDFTRITSAPLLIKFAKEERSNSQQVGGEDAGRAGA